LPGRDRGQLPYGLLLQQSTLLYREPVDHDRCVGPSLIVETRRGQDKVILVSNRTSEVWFPNAEGSSA
jgi:hypothetical protein